MQHLQHICSTQSTTSDSSCVYGRLPLGLQLLSCCLGSMLSKDSVGKHMGSVRGSGKHETSERHMDSITSAFLGVQIAC